MKIRILLVEDEELAARVLEMVLQPMTSRIVHVGELREAKEYASRETFDAILLDLTLKDSNPEETIESIGYFREVSHAPIIVISGSVRPSMKERCLAAGASAFLMKPDAYNGRNRALLLALHAAIMANPRQSPSEQFLAHVSVLEQMCSA